MTIAFASVMAVFIIERIDETTGQASLFPLLIAGAGSVAYWRWAPCWFVFNLFLSKVPSVYLIFLGAHNNSAWGLNLRSTWKWSNTLIHAGDNIGVTGFLSCRADVSFVFEQICKWPAHICISAVCTLLCDSCNGHPSASQIHTFSLLALGCRFFLFSKPVMTL